MRFSSYEAMLHFNHGTIECPYCFNETDAESESCEVCERSLSKDDDY